TEDPRGKGTYERTTLARSRRCRRERRSGSADRELLAQSYALPPRRETPDEDRSPIWHNTFFDLPVLLRRSCTAGRSRPLRRAALADDRALPRRPHGRGLRRPEAAEPLLHGGQQRRRLEERRLRPHVDADLRRPADGLDRRARGGPVGSEHPLCRER